MHFDGLFSTEVVKMCKWIHNILYCTADLWDYLQDLFWKIKTVLPLILQALNVTKADDCTELLCGCPIKSHFLNGPFPASFFFIFVFSTLLTVNKC